MSKIVFKLTKQDREFANGAISLEVSDIAIPRVLEEVHLLNRVYSVARIRHLVQIKEVHVYLN